jgi:hypothetical protein
MLSTTDEDFQNLISRKIFEVFKEAIWFGQQGVDRWISLSVERVCLSKWNSAETTSLSFQKCMMKNVLLSFVLIGIKFLATISADIYI